MQCATTLWELSEGVCTTETFVEETADFYNENDEEQTDQSNSHASEDDDEFQPKVISGDCLDEFGILNNQKM